MEVYFFVVNQGVCKAKEITYFMKIYPSEASPSWARAMVGSLYILASCMLYFPLLIYLLHACLICIVIVKLVPKLHFNLKKLKTATFST